MIIAIDGTTSSGKGTLAKRLAAHFGLPYAYAYFFSDGRGVEQALDRVARMKARYVGAPAPPDLVEARKLLRCAPHLALVEQLASVHVGGPVRGDSPVDLG